jgi:hypothetical protein
MRFEVKDNTVYANGEKVVGTIGKTYPETEVYNDEYYVVGVHDENQNCYAYLEKVFVGDMKTGVYALVRAWERIGNNSDNYNSKVSKLQSIRQLEGSKSKFVIDSYYTQDNGMYVYVNAHNVLAPAVKPLTVVRPDLIDVGGGKMSVDINDIASCFNYEVCSDMSVIMDLKYDVSRRQMIRWPYFTAQYDIFKLVGNFGCGNGDFYLQKENSMSTGSFVMRSNSFARFEENLVKELRKCIKQMIPNHPQVIEDSFFNTDDIIIR